MTAQITRTESAKSEILPGLPSNEFGDVPRWWVTIEDLPEIDQICDELKFDPLLADEFFFQEMNDPASFEDGAFRPLYDFHALILLEIENNEYIWIQASRGSSKSYSVARALVLRCLRRRGERVIITAPSFRQSKGVFDYCIEILKANFGVDSHVYKLEQEIDLENDMKRGHEVIATFSTTSSIEALPMGTDGSKNRGKRATIVVLDEFFMFKRDQYVSHIQPFLNVQMGIEPPKMIYMTTSFYQDCYAYEVLMNIAMHVKAGTPGYSIIDLTIDDIMDSQRIPRDDEGDDPKQPTFPVALKHILHQLESERNPITGELSEDALMSLYNVWIKSSANFYKTDAIAQCQQDSVPVLARQPAGMEAPWVLGVDPAAHGSDKTAMAAISCPGNNDRRLHAVYQWEKLKPAEIAGYIHQMVDRYPGINLIVMDKSGSLGNIVADECGKEMQCINGIYEARPPILPWDHPDAYKARAVIVLTKPADEKMSSGVYGDEYGKQITGEIDLKNAFHISMKAMFENGKFLAPNAIDSAAYYQADMVQSTVGSIMDNIRESLSQFPRIDRKRATDGKSLATDARGNWYFTKPPKDDGAYSIIYANWAANIHYKQSVAKRNGDPFILWDEEEPLDAPSTHTIIRPIF